MIVRKLRLKRSWSQEQLAELSGLSVRTIQRAERGQSVGVESLKCLAAVFENQIEDLQEEQPMQNPTILTQEEQQVIERVRDIKGFYSHAIGYVFVIIGLSIVNYFFSPYFPWVLIVALSWGFGLASHGLSVFEVFNFFGADWEKRQIEKRLGRKL